MIKSVPEPRNWLSKIPQFLLVLQDLKNVYYTDANSSQKYEEPAEANKERKLKFCVPKIYFEEGLKLVEQNKTNDMILMKNILRIRQHLQTDLKSILFNSKNQ